MKRKTKGIILSLSLVLMLSACTTRDSAHDVKRPDRQESVQISARSAREIALEDAGLSEADTVELACERQGEEDEKIYVLRFTASSGTSYCYEISAADGEILSCSRVAASASDKTAAAQDEKMVRTFMETSVQASARSESETAGITESEAVELALTYAGLTQADVLASKIELERKDDRRVYDIEFILQSGCELDCEVSATDGAILRCAYDDIATADTPDAGRTGNELTRERALEIALEHGGVSEDSLDNCRRPTVRL